MSSPLIQYAANARNPQSDPSIHPFGSDITPNMSLFLSNQTLINYRSVSIQLNYLLIRASASDLLIWKSYFLCIQALKLSSYIYNPMPLHSFFFLVSIDTHIRSFMDRHILGWIILQQCRSYSLNLWVLPWHIMPLVNSIISFCQPWSAFELVYFNPEASGICS